MGTVDTTFSSSSRDSHMTLGWDNPTADPTTTILLRHGDTRLSPEHRFSGQRDLPLSAIGTRQAQAAACRLATGAPINAVVSSPRSEERRVGKEGSSRRARDEQDNRET